MPPSPTSLPSQSLLSASPDISLSLSPSKALHHQLTTNAWSQITTFLTRLYSPHPVPLFERNNATLAYFQSLMTANMRADQRRKALHEVQLEQLRKYEEYEAATSWSPETGLLRDLKKALGDERRKLLREMARGYVAVGIMPSADVCSSSDRGDVTTAAGKRIMELTQELFKLQNQVEELSSLKQRFDREKKTTEEETRKLREPTESEDAELDPNTHGIASPSASDRVPLETLLAQISNFNTSTKQLTLKIKEYQDRINGLNRALEVQRQDEGDVTIEDVQHREKVLQQRRVDVQKLEAKLRAFNGLPPDIEASREEVQRAQGELEEWRRRREAAFEEISGG